MIDKNKQYRTRDGREVRIYATDGAYHNCIHGAVKTEDGWLPLAWKSNGNYYHGSESEYDLIEVRSRHKRTVWVNVYSTSRHVEAFVDRLMADKMSASSRIACIKVELDFEEGEGL